MITSSGASTPPSGGMVAVLALLVAAGLAVGVAALVYRHRTARRLRDAGLVECGLRVVTGDVPGLSRRWRHGSAGRSAAGTAGAGTLVYHQGRLGGYVRGRDPRAADVVVHGPALAARPARVREWVAIAPGAKVLTAPQPGGAVVEVVVLPADAAQLQQWLFG